MAVIEGLSCVPGWFPMAVTCGRYPGSRRFFLVDVDLPLALIQRSEDFRREMEEGGIEAANINRGMRTECLQYAVQHECGHQWWMDDTPPATLEIMNEPNAQVDLDLSSASPSFGLSGNGSRRGCTY